MKAVLLVVVLYYIITVAFGYHEDSDTKYVEDSDVEYVECGACPEDVLERLGECNACPDDVLGYLKYEKKKCGATSCNVLDKLSECKVCPDQNLYKLGSLESKLDELLAKTEDCVTDEDEEEGDEEEDDDEEENDDNDGYDAGYKSKKGKY
eukprot:359857_1